MKHFRPTLHRLASGSARAALLMASLAIWSGCGDDKTAEQHEPAKKMRLCEPGTIYSCVQVGCDGRQACRADGSGYLPCSCSNIDSAGSAGKPATRAPDAGPMKHAGKPDAASASHEPDASPSASQELDAATPEHADAATSHDAGQSAEPASGAPAPPAAERCDNGEDDDGDGRVDCADEDCAAVRCIETAPSGWHGPVAFRTAAAPITCSGTFDQLDFEAGAGPEAEPASCSACTCQGECGAFADFRTSTGAQCGGTSCSTSVNASCIEISPQCLQGATTAYLKTALPNGASCTASEQRPTLPEGRWKEHASACKSGGASRGGCEADQLCLPKEPGAGFEAAYCIWQAGDVACPADKYTQRRIYHKEISDTRSCSPCSCSDSACSYTWRVFNVDDAMCTSPVLELSAVDQCAQVNPVMGKLRVGFAKGSTGACTPAGGESRGGVTAAGPVTVCCSS